MNILIFGAGNCGRLLAENVFKKKHHLLGFVDNDLAKRGQRIALDFFLNGGGGNSQFLRPMI